MKIPSSSSLLFATLAISSSSSTLTAPTGPDVPHAEGGMASSPSETNLSARRDSVSTGGLPPSARKDVLEARFLGLDNIVCPALNSVAGVLGCHNKFASQALEASQSGDPQESITHAEAVDALRMAITTLEMASKSQDPAGQDLSGDQLSPPSSIASDASTPASTASTSLSASDYSTSSPASPPMPENPRNSLAMSASPEPTEAPSRRDATGAANPRLKHRRLPVPPMRRWMRRTVQAPAPVQDHAPAPVQDVPAKASAAKSAAVGAPSTVVEHAPAPVANSAPAPILMAPGTAGGIIFPIAGTGESTAANTVGGAADKA